MRPKPRWRSVAATRVGVRAADLVVGDGLAGLDEFIAGRDHHDRRLVADPYARHAGGGRDRDFRRPQQRAGLQQQRSLAAVRCRADARC